MKKFLSLVFILFSFLSFSQLTPAFVQLKPHYKYNVRFNYTGAQQTWTVPAGVTEIFVDVAGAQGGSLSTIEGGKGGKISCKLAVSPGTVFYLTVGGQSSNQTAVFGFGGNGGASTNYGFFGMAGGGLSALATATPLSHSNALIVAAGGGGANASTGGFGGGTIGADGGGNWNGMLRGGKGASLSSGGVAGTTLDTNSILPTNGTILNGGNGGTVGGLSSNWNGGGGGGAGYYGGGGGTGGGNAQGGGGGGSSWAHVSCLQISNISNFCTGNGRIFIYYN